MDTLRNGQNPFHSRTCLELLEHTASNIRVNNESGRVDISPYIQGCVVSQVLGSSAVVCKAIVLFCEISGFCVLVVCFIAWNMDSHSEQNKKIFYQAISEVP